MIKNIFRLGRKVLMNFEQTWEKWENKLKTFKKCLNFIVLFMFKIYMLTVT